MDIFKTVLELLPLAGLLIRERLEAGETAEEVRKDIEDRREQVRVNRERRDAEFREKFGRDPS